MKPQPYGPYRFIPITKRPKQSLPGGARIAVWVIPNIESFALDEKVPGGSPKVPDVRNFAVRDYGNRVGVFRLADTLTKFGIRGTVALNSDVCDRFPEVIEHTAALGWEFMGHNQSNSRLLNEIPPEQERDVVLAALARIEKAVGRRPRGWLGSGLTETWNTLDYLIEGGVEYICDWVNDDQPYLMEVGGKRIVSIPYSIEINDLPVIATAKHTAFEFADMIRAQFDVLYREGAESARVMAIALHPFIIGQPHRIGALESALEYICRHSGVWLATGSEIVDNFLSDKPF
jgi:allantoinase